jgi:RimJ/RimL family protein N-acetyltransferase
MNSLKSIKVDSLDQVEVMRNIYNDNLDMLSTIPLPFRTSEDQQIWWNENKQKLSAFLYEPLDQPGKYIAFLVLTNIGLFDTPIIAIKKEEWGSGYGQEIVKDYISKANRPLAGSQLQKNAAICHINRKVGWQILGERNEINGVVDLLYHPGINQNIENPEYIYKTILKYHNIIE